MNREMLRAHALSSMLLALLLAGASPLDLLAQRPASPPPSADIVELWADSQQKAGEIYLLRGNVEIRYRGMMLRADEVTYDEKARTAQARGNVVFERDDDRIEASEARYRLATGEGTFLNVRGTVGRPPRPSREYLLTTNPFYFEAERVERRSDGSYLAQRAWVTNCQPGRPRWRIKTARATIRPGRDVRSRRATLLIGGVPVLYTPYAALSIADQPRNSGFLWPSFGNDSRRGTNFGTGFFWAINPHADARFDVQFFNQGGWTQTAEFRALPTVNSRVQVNYFGAQAGKLRRTQERRRTFGVDQSGQSAQVLAETTLPNGLRAVADLEFLSSMRFRQGFAETLTRAIQAEVKSDLFVTANPDTFYFNGYFRRYQNFIQAFPESSVTLTSAPSFDAGTRPRLLRWLENQPLYFSLDAHAGGMQREEPRYGTPGLVQRFDLYPRVTLPLRLGRHFGLTPTFGVRASRYGARLVRDASDPNSLQVVNEALRRTMAEVSVDLRLPSLARIFEGGRRHYKHVIEPEITYRYVNGVRDFDQVLLFDERDILTNTHEIEYALTQRLYLRHATGREQAREFIQWRVAQKYYFDPEFGGALRPGARNVFAALASVTPFAFADRPRRLSPLVSTLRVTPGGRYDTDFRVDYDASQRRILNTRLRASAQVTDLIRLHVAHLAIRGREILQPRSNQVWAVASYGELFRRGFNAAFGMTWDIRQDFLPSTRIQTSYNWDCCGVAFSFQRLGLGLLRSQNEYSFSLTLANIGNIGTLRLQDRLF